MDILKAIIDARADYLDDGVLRLLASELKKRQTAFIPRPKQPRPVQRKAAKFPKHQFRTRA